MSVLMPETLTSIITLYIIVKHVHNSKYFVIWELLQEVEFEGWNVK